MKIELTVTSDRPLNHASVLYALNDAVAEYHKYLTWHEIVPRKFELPIDGKEYLKVAISE